MHIDRRDLLKMAALSLATQVPLKRAHAALDPIRSGFAARVSAISAAQSASPLLDIGVGAFSTKTYNGDNEDIPHDLLWDRAGFLQRMGGIPKPSESCDVIVIGGGLAGLMTSYLAPQKDVIVLEQDVRFGGNSKGEIHRTSDGAHAFSQGGAYVVVPEANDSLDTLLKELKLKGRVEETTPIFFGGQLHEDLWSSSVAPQAKADLEKVRAKLEEINENAYPAIPLEGSAAEIAEVRRLDKMTFEQWITSELGAIHPLILEFFQLYCWSSFNASIDEISAAQALNFIAAETGGIMAFPGGNSAIADALYRSLLARRGASSLRASSFVVDVTVTNDRVRVCTYENQKLKTIEAEKAVFAAPKFLAKTILTDMPADLKGAFDDLMYRAYLVANVKLREPLKSPAFDIFSLEGQVPPTPAAMRRSPRDVIDVICGDWARGGATASSTVLSLYLPLPFDGARQFLFNPASHDQYRNAALEAVKPHLSALGLRENAVEGVRMTRWGHALPVASKGFIADGNAELIERGMKGRLLFAGQDVWANPALETALATAERAVARL